MIPFSEKYHEDIKAGKITLTFRDWSTLNLKKNKIYKSRNLGLLRINNIGFKRLVDVGTDEIKRCGHKNINEFKVAYENVANRKIDFNTESSVIIEFEYMGDDIENKKRSMGKITTIELFEIKQKLLEMDGECNSPWAIVTLKALESGGVFKLADLERTLCLPSEKLKHGMCRLRELNLVCGNNNKGYSITPLSLKLLRLI